MNIILKYKHNTGKLIVFMCCVFLYNSIFAQNLSSISLAGNTKERIDKYDKKQQIKENDFDLKTLNNVVIEIIYLNKTIAKTSSDANGNFSIEFDIKQKSVYDIKYSKSGFYPKISRFKTNDCENELIYSFDNWNISLRKKVEGLPMPSKLIPFEVYYYDSEEEAFEIDYEYEMDYNKIAEEIYANIEQEVKTNDAFSEIKQSALNELKAELITLRDNTEEQCIRNTSNSLEKINLAKKEADNIIKLAKDSAQKIIALNKITESKSSKIEYIYVPIDSTKTTIKSEQKFKNFEEKILDNEDNLNIAGINIMRRRDEVEKAKRQLDLDRLLAKTKEDSMLIAQRQMEIDAVSVSIENYEARVKEANTKLEMQSYQLEMQKMSLYVGMVILFIITIFSFVLFRLFKQKQKVNGLLEQKNIEIEEMHNDVVSSIRYAQRIQTAILPPHEFMQSKLQNEFFVLFKPKDIVSGDFYWMDEKNDKILISAIDCTGHGVPGAFMSMIGYNSLNKAVKEYGLTRPSDILNAQNKFIAEALRKSTNKTIRDGMDMAFISIDYRKNILEYSGAYNPLYIVRNGELIHIKADNIAIGSYFQDSERKYTNHSIELKKGDSVYIFTDGYADQFGGGNFRKFMYKRFREVLLEINAQPMQKQEELLWQRLNEWKEDEEQIDDICVIGIKI